MKKGKLFNEWQSLRVSLVKTAYIRKNIEWTLWPKTQKMEIFNNKWRLLDK